MQVCRLLLSRGVFVCLSAEATGHSDEPLKRYIANSTHDGKMLIVFPHFNVDDEPEFIPVGQES